MNDVDQSDSGYRLDPIPAILIESMRDIGYSFDTALADIVDNSLSAGASLIQIETQTIEKPVLAVIDNGEGLTKSELLQSMRMGSLDPRVTRSRRDLGRFGLGMKTASFSQCRKLTVVSRRFGILSGFIWDLDHVEITNQWEVLEVTDYESVPFFELLPDDCGTMVVWEKIDRALGATKCQEAGNAVFNRLVSEAEDHLALVFHRFIGFEPGYKKITMRLNGRDIEPLDPFNSQHEALISGIVEALPDGITVQGFTLPHASKYETIQEYDRYALPGGYLKNQGIYLYRERRLIIHGTWFNLAKKTVSHQLCRVKIDIDNLHDEEWKIDVKKASAQLPENVRETVRNLYQRLVRPSNDVIRRRGAKQVSKDLHPAWNDIRSDGKVSYKINRDHPVLVDFRAGLDAEDAKKFDVVIGLIETGLPTDSIVYELTTDPDKVRQAQLKDEDFSEAARLLFESLKGMGQDDEAVLDVMRRIEPFGVMWDQTLSVLGIVEE